MVTGAGKRKDCPQWDDPRVVEKDEGLQGKPSYVYITTRVHKLKLFPVWTVRPSLFENHIHHAITRSFSITRLHYLTYLILHSLTYKILTLSH